MGMCGDVSRFQRGWRGSSNARAPKLFHARLCSLEFSCRESGAGMVVMRSDVIGKREALLRRGDCQCKMNSEQVRTLFAPWNPGASKMKKELMAPGSVLCPSQPQVPLHVVLSVPSLCCCDRPASEQLEPCPAYTGQNCTHLLAPLSV